MTAEQKLKRILEAVQQDVGNRGLARLFELTSGDFAPACRHLASAWTSLGVVTGFWIPGIGLGETDGPLGAVYLARTLGHLSIRVQIISDPFCQPSLVAGLTACGLTDSVPVSVFGQELIEGVTHILAIERVGPNHVPDSVGGGEALQAFLDEVPPAHRDRCHTMRGIDITDHMLDAAGFFERPNPSGSYPPHGPLTFGIGDGGNEIGMGKVPWKVIRDDIRNGGLIACRIPTDFLVVAGISNWGAYALACGIAVVRGVRPPDDWFDIDLERRILLEMVERGPLVDGVTGRAEASVDGLPFDRYIEPLRQMERIVRC